MNPEVDTLGHEDGPLTSQAPAPPAPVSRPDLSGVPRVNLLPPEIIEAGQLRLLQRVLAAAVLVVAALIGLTVTWSQLGVNAAGDDLARVRTETEALQREQAKYADVPAVQKQLDDARAGRETALGADVLWYRFLTDLAVNTPPGTALQSVTISMTGLTPTPAADPLSPAGLGTVQVTGETTQYSQVANWLDAVNKVSGLAGSSLQSATRAVTGGTTKVSYSGSAVITPTALSHRYDRKAD